jgi:hypothetical protein
MRSAEQLTTILRSLRRLLSDSRWGSTEGSEPESRPALRGVDFNRMQLTLRDNSGNSSKVAEGGT